MELDLDAIISELSSEKCSVHNQQAKLSITIEGKISSTTCCVEFGKTMGMLIQQRTGDAINRKILEAFRGTKGGII